MKKVSLLTVLLCLGACAPTKNNAVEKTKRVQSFIKLGFVNTLGTHQIAEKYKITIQADGDYFKYLIFYPGGGSGPSIANLKKGSNWFIYAESLNKYWIYNGEKLSLCELSHKTGNQNHVKLSDFSLDRDRFLKEMPIEVKDKIPSAILK
ncbi:MAG: hypothetical protein ACI8RA_003148 [Chlamydiales bacterium]|jgi:hypothetical protein